MKRYLNMNTVTRLIRSVGWYGWMLIGALALGGMVLLVRHAFPNANPDVVAGIGAFVIGGLFVLILT
jgi:hypothetical protein